MVCPVPVTVPEAKKVTTQTLIAEAKKRFRDVIQRGFPIPPSNATPVQKKMFKRPACQISGTLIALSETWLSWNEQYVRVNSLLDRERLWIRDECLEFLRKRNKHLVVSVIRNVDDLLDLYLGMMFSGCRRELSQRRCEHIKSVILMLGGEKVVESLGL